MGYSNLFKLLSVINALEEFKTNKLATRIKVLKKFENASLSKESKKIFSLSFDELKIIKAVITIINDDKLNIKLKLFFVNTPIIKILNIDNVRNISGNIIFKLLIIFC